VKSVYEKRGWETRTKYPDPSASRSLPVQVAVEISGPPR
jgi:hypothetical protein